MESQVTLDRVCSKEDFTVTGQNQQESIECLKNTKKKKQNISIEKIFLSLFAYRQLHMEKGSGKKKGGNGRQPRKNGDWSVESAPARQTQTQKYRKQFRFSFFLVSFCHVSQNKCVYSIVPLSFF